MCGAAALAAAGAGLWQLAEYCTHRWVSALDHWCYKSRVHQSLSLNQVGSLSIPRAKKLPSLQHSKPRISVGGACGESFSS